MEVHEFESIKPTERRIEHRRSTYLRRIGSVTIMSLIGAGAFIAWDAWDTEREEPFVGPEIINVDNHPDGQPTMPCGEADSVLVTGSSMGLQVSKYMGANVAEIANSHGMCVWAVEMGTYYNDSVPDQVAEELVTKIADEVSTDEQIKLIFWGESWGGNLLQRVANSQAIQEADSLEVAGIILESVPSGMDSVRWPGAKLMLEMNKRDIWLGRRVLYLLGVGGMAYQYVGEADVERFLSVHLKDASINSDRTSPRLIGHQGADIAVNGFPHAEKAGDNSAPVMYVAWRGDQTVDNKTSIDQISSRLEVPISVAWIDSGDDLRVKHAECWKEHVFKQYCVDVMGQIFGEYTKRG